MVDQNASTEYWTEAVRLIEQALQADQAEAIFKLLLTSDERDAIGIRVQIIKALLAGELNQRDLKDKLGTGIATITRGSNSLKEADSQFKVWLTQQLLPASSLK